MSLEKKSPLFSIPVRDKLDYINWERHHLNQGCILHTQAVDIFIRRNVSERLHPRATQEDSSRGRAE
jgi:hypothetical protein